MCGLFGISLPPGAPPPPPSLLRAVSRALRHRGPDDEGYLLADRAGVRSYAGSDTPPRVREALGLTLLPERPAACEPAAWDVALGARRLAIQDLSPAGHQPMGDAAGERWLAFNGEVYGHAALRAELEAAGERFRGTSDTEVLLAAWRVWGPACLSRLNGEWAFALLDRPARRLWLCRDRFGIKPLYYTWDGAWDGARLAFASELRPLLRLASLAPEPRPAAVFSFLAAGLSDHEPETLIAGARQLLGGELLELDLDARTLSVRRWYDLPTEESAPQAPEAHADPVATLRGLLEDSVALRLQADVPVGTCLSGGLDSSTLVGIAARLRRERPSAARSLGARVHTFSARFPGLACDEGRFVDAVVARAEATPHAATPRGEDLVAELAALGAAQDLPVGGPAVYAQARVFRLAREAGVPVTLDGQGADELLAGYLEHQSVHWVALARAGRLASLSRELGGAGRAHLRPLLRALLPAAGLRWRRRLRLGDLRALAPDLARAHASELAPRPTTLDAALRDALLVSVLPSLLRYADRSSMASAVEARLPFLDHRLVELLIALPATWKLRDGERKWLLRRAAAPDLPPEVLARRDKLGFAVPAEAWLRGPLAPSLDALCAAPRGTWFDPAGLRALVAAQRRGVPGLGGALWRCLSLDLWQRALAGGVERG
ncbi:MAG: asparagine synthase (glutamine-hydrolyzing) [Planctomycetota bacterium]